MLAYTVHDAIDTIAGLSPGSRAFLSSGIDVSYQQLASDALQVSRFILSQGLKTGDRVAIMMPPSYLHVMMIVALDRLGVASLSHVVDKEMMNHSWNQALGLECVFSSESKPENTDVKWIEVDASTPVQALPVDSEFADADIPVDREPTRIVRFVSSSGTTGCPKVIALSREIVMKRVVAHHLFCEGMGSNRFLIGMPLPTIAGYGWLLMVLCRGATAVPCLDPIMIVRFIDAFQLSHLLLTPILFHNVIEIGQQSGRNFTSVCMTTTGGTPFDIRLASRARAVLGNNIWNGYTSTEAGSVARGHIDQVETNPNMIGSVLPFVTLEIVDENNNLMDIGEKGIVRIASELAVSKYETDEDGDQGAVFHDGFVYPGDLGSLDDKGRLRILGRVDEMINLRGIKLAPEDLERPIAGLQGVREASVFQADLGQGLTVCAAVVLDGDQAGDDVMERIRKSLGKRAPQHIKTVSELPRNAMGKVMRRELASQFSVIAPD